MHHPDRGTPAARSFYTTMAYTNHLLFNNSFLDRLTFPPEEVNAAWDFILKTCRDYYRAADFSSPKAVTDSLVRPLLQIQGLDLTPTGLAQPDEYLLAAAWEPDSPLALLTVAPHSQPLDGMDADGRIPKGAHWMIRSVDAAQRAGVRWAFLTNGRQWRLLDASHLRCYEAYLEINLEKLVTVRHQDDALNIPAALFHTIFRLQGSLEEGGAGLVRLIDQSAGATLRTERYLKRVATDSPGTPGSGDGVMANLCMGLARAMDPNQTRVFTEHERAEIYQDATYLLYRLLFILYAEARGLLPLDDPAYRAVSLHQLVETALQMDSNFVLRTENPTRLWDALKSLFNYIDIGDAGAHIPQFDGGLFDDRERPCLSQPDVKIANEFLYLVLRDLTRESDPDPRIPSLKIDYRDLSVRHLGSLYEGMIEYQLFIAEEDMAARSERDGRVSILPAREAPPGFNGETIPAGHVYFAQSPHEKKATGTHYTAENLVEKLVRQTVLRTLDKRWQAFQPELTRLLAEAAAVADAQQRAGMQRYIDEKIEQFIETEVLSLRVCDPAMGSGHFLVHTAHQMTRFIVHALASTPWHNSQVDLAPETWRRKVVERCLYGVDINPMAVELAKLSLWLATMHAGRALSFLDHHLKAGNSLLGVRLEEIARLLQGAPLDPKADKMSLAESRGQYSLPVDDGAQQALQDALGWLEHLSGLDASQAAGVDGQKQDYRHAEERLAAYRAVGDLLVAHKMGLKAAPDALHSAAQALQAGAEPRSDAARKVLDEARRLLDKHKPFHWDLEFPDVCRGGQGGFDVVIGNPPFVSGKSISTQLGQSFRTYIINSFPPAINNADLSCYFLRIAFMLVNLNGCFGFVTTNTVSQGDSRETGLVPIIESGGVIFFAEQFVKWLGDANVEVNLITLKKNKISCPNPILLDNIEVTYISTRLDTIPENRILILSQNNAKAFIGDFTRGDGFFLSKQEGETLLTPQNEGVIFPFLNGRDVNEEFGQQPSRYAICFHDWDLQKAEEYSEVIDIIRRKVKPFREKVFQEKDRKYWWLYNSYRKGMRGVIQGLSKVLIRSRVSEYHMLVFVQKGWIYSDAIVVFAYDDMYHFALLQSWLHEVWLRRQASTMRTDIRYTPTDCFQTFPFPQAPSASQRAAAEAAGQAFYDHRQACLQARQLGLTKLYNLFHNPACADDDIQEMRRLSAAMDNAVLACYGWQDVDLAHGFHANDRKKIRWMPAPAAQRELFIRLMALNQQVAAEEARRGLRPAVTTDSDDEEDAHD